MNGGLGTLPPTHRGGKKFIGKHAHFRRNPSSFRARAPEPPHDAERTGEQAARWRSISGSAHALERLSSADAAIQQRPFLTCFLAAPRTTGLTGGEGHVQGPVFAQGTRRAGDRRLA